jgi:hypothetical protein
MFIKQLNSFIGRCVVNLQLNSIVIILFLVLKNEYMNSLTKGVFRVKIISYGKCSTGCREGLWRCRCMMYTVTAMAASAGHKGAIKNNGPGQ